jgi:hypothetical protein
MKVPKHIRRSLNKLRSEKVSLADHERVVERLGRGEEIDYDGGHIDWHIKQVALWVDSLSEEEYGEEEYHAPAVEG